MANSWERYIAGAVGVGNALHGIFYAIFFRPASFEFHDVECRCCTGIRVFMYFYRQEKIRVVYVEEHARSIVLRRNTRKA